jgi:hypothetical protein
MDFSELYRNKTDCYEIQIRQPEEYKDTKFSYAFVDLADAQCPNYNKEYGGVGTYCPLCATKLERICWSEIVSLYDAHYGDERICKVTWLPKIDDLLGMLTEESCFLLQYIKGLKFKEGNWFGSGITKNNERFAVVADSPEQTVLEAVMRLEYNMIWKDGLWIFLN